METSDLLHVTCDLHTQETMHIHTTSIKNICVQLKIRLQGNSPSYSHIGISCKSVALHEVLSTVVHYGLYFLGSFKNKGSLCFGFFFFESFLHLSFHWCKCTISQFNTQGEFITLTYREHYSIFMPFSIISSLFGQHCKLKYSQWCIDPFPERLQCRVK